MLPWANRATGRQCEGGDNDPNHQALCRWAEAQCDHVVHWDDALPGFGVRVRPSGAKSYLFVYRLGGGRRGRQRRLTLGAASSSADRAGETGKRRKVFTAEEARKAAQKASAAAGAGGDPAGDKTAQRGDLTVAELITRYLKDGPSSRPAKKAKSWEHDDSNLRRHVLPLLGRQHLRSLAKADIEKFQADVTQARPRPRSRRRAPRSVAGSGCGVVLPLQPGRRRPCGRC